MKACGNVILHFTFRFDSLFKQSVRCRHATGSVLVLYPLHNGSMDVKLLQYSHVPHLFITAQDGRRCIPFGKAVGTMVGRVYYWSAFLVLFAIPFVCLLIMNSFIIHIIRNRFKFHLFMSASQGQGQVQNEGHNEGQTSKIKSSEMQIYIILLLVTFAFLVLMTPGYVLFVYVMLVDYRKTPQSYAGYIFIHSFSQKTFYTNYGINFFLYVISGKKFRSDLLWLFRKKLAPSSDQPSNASNTVMTVAAS